MGDARSKDMSAVPERSCWSHCQPLLHHHVSVELASAGTAEAD
jgi:hypothetical protein